MLARHVDGRIRRAADEDMDRHGRLHLREAALDLIILAGIVEWFLARPFLLDDIEPFAGAGVTLVLVVERIAVLPQLLGIAAGDDMQRDAAMVEILDGGELARQHRRRGETRTLRDHHLQLLGHAERMLGDLQAVRRGRMEGEQRAVEPASSCAFATVSI
jgi:hypothetical protein